jgi:serpin B
MNVVSFAAAWAEPFAPAGDEPFTLAGGSTVQVPMMSQVLAANYAAGPGWQAVELPYSEGFLMRLVLPDTGSPVFDAARLAEVEDLLAQGAPAAVLLGLPTWTHRGTLDLVPVLAGLGLAGMAGMEPDFEAIHAQARIGAAAQAVAITVAEQGTVAAAVTEFGLCGSLPRRPEKELVFDRPFLYQIIHAGTGMPLFLGTVMDPR